MKVDINLLPKHKKEEIIRAKKFHAVLFWEGIVLCIGMLFLMFTFGVDYLLKLEIQSISSVGSEFESGKYQKIVEYEKEFSAMNKEVDDVHKITNNQSYWSELFLRLNDVLTDDIEISALTTKNFSIFLAGTAKTRDGFLAFGDNLKQDDCFEEVNMPLSNLVSQENVVFQIDLKIKKDCINNK